jgi:imidazolonepropionase-like amidohydrolase
MKILKNARILTMTGERPLLEPFVGDLAMEEGCILQIGEEIKGCGDDEILDLDGAYVTPGLIDAHSHVGLMQSGSRDSDHNEKSNPITPQLRALDAFHPFDSALADARSGGVTSCVTCPGSINLIGGSCAAVKMAGNVVEDMLIVGEVAMKGALGENPIFRYNEQNKTPRSRMAAAALIRDALAGAADYKRKVELAADRPERMPDRDLGKEALVRLLQGEMHLKIHVHRSDDIATAVRIANEFGLSYTLDHCTEGFRVLPLLEAQVKKGLLRGVIAGPLLGYKRKAELNNSRYLELPRILHEAGIPFAICTDFYETPQHFLRGAAILAVAEGLEEGAALKAITCAPATILGLGNRVGSLKPGLDADLAVFSGPPMEVGSHCLMTIIDGKIVYERGAQRV